MGSSLSALFSRPSHHVPTVHFSSCPVDVPVTTSDADTTASMSMEAIIDAALPSLKAPYIAPWWMHNGHIQTGYCVVGDFTQVDKIVYKRQLLRTTDGGTLGLDFTPFSSEKLSADTPILVVLHGLTGGSHESYVRAVLAPSCKPVSEGGLGYRGVVITSRGCAGVPLTSPQLYSVGSTEDVRVALMYLANKFPNAPMMGVGFSLGANILTRYLAEEGEQSRLISGCALSSPWNVAKNAAHVEGTWFNRSVYSKAMAANLMNVLKQNSSALSKFTDHPISQAIQDVLSLDEPYMFQFDNLITRQIGGSSAHFPFPTQFDYYKWSGSDHVIGDIRVPYLAISSDDDPLLAEAPQTCDNGWVTLAFTARGGHLGWFETGENGEMKRWLTKPVLEWTKGLLGRLALDEQGNIKGRQCRPITEVDGFLREAGYEQFGCHEIEADADQFVGFQPVKGLLQGL